MTDLTIFLPIRDLTHYSSLTHGISEDILIGISATPLTRTSMRRIRTTEFHITTH